MTDRPTQAHDSVREHNPPAGDSGANTASKVLFDDSQSGKTVGRFNPSGHGEALACKTNPESGTVPALMPGRDSHGCDFKGMKDLPKNISHLDFPNVYDQAAPSTVRLDATIQGKGAESKHKQDGPMGTGAIIGKDNEKGECLVATADHNLSGDGHATISNMRATTSDGKTYPTEARYQDHKRDTAVITMKTGADTDKVCKPFTPVQDISKEAGKGAPIVALGFAQGSKAMYASPGTSDGVHKLKEDMSPANIRELGLDPNGNQLRMNLQLRGGQSGGPVVNEHGRLTGLNQSSPEGDFRHSSAVPLDQKRVDELLAKARK